MIAMAGEHAHRPDRLSSSAKCPGIRSGPARTRRAVNQFFDLTRVYPVWLA
jgi:hypothetical protein